ncbi:DsbA family protein [Kordiimonas gwangyangensis]|uniref:DsbA family protein n=1 Tax=Kordiimonas gwangyangensis TaxID=288022 RepID=UPI00036E19E0|nr:DsbA family protein [Kordiimonas gwangyangensis]
MSYNRSAFVRYAFGASMALMLAACGDSSETGTTGGAKFDMPATELTAEQAAAEGTWGDIVYGDPNAPVTVVEYASLTCPHCATFSKEHFPEFKKKYIDTGKVKLLYRNFIMNRVDLMASAVARCGDMEVTQKLMSVFFARQYDWARSENPVDELASLARRVGISRTEFDKCVNNKEMHKHLMALTKTAVDDYQVNSTPSFFVNGERMDFTNFDDLDEKLTKAIGAN